MRSGRFEMKFTTVMAGLQIYGIYNTRREINIAIHQLRSSGWYSLIEITEHLSTIKELEMIEHSLSRTINNHLAFKEYHR